MDEDAPDKGEDGAGNHAGDEADVTRPRGRKTAGAYDLIRVLGSGGFGTVYEARHRGTGRSFAVKRLALTRDDAERFEKEALYPSRAATQSLHILDVREFFEEEPSFYLVTELVPHGDLRRFLDTSARPIPVRDALEIGLGIARGLAAIHALGIVHRDLKPANVLMAHLDERWVPKIADFGVARSTESLSIGDFASAGYAAPEQVDLISADPVDAPADLFALGMLLFELFTGENASGKKLLREYAQWIALHVTRAPTAPGASNPELVPSHRRPQLAEWPDIDRVISALLLADPHRRIPARDVIDAFEGVLAGFAQESRSRLSERVVPETHVQTARVPTAAAGAITQPAVSTRPHMYGAVLAAAILVPVSFFLFYFLSRPQPPQPKAPSQAGVDPIFTGAPPVAARGAKAGPPAGRGAPEASPRAEVAPRSGLAPPTQTPATAASGTAPAGPPGTQSPEAAAPEKTPAVVSTSTSAAPPATEPQKPQPTASVLPVVPPINPRPNPSAPLVDEGIVRTLAGRWTGALLDEKGLPFLTDLNLRQPGEANAGTVAYGQGRTLCIYTLRWVEASATRARLAETVFRGNGCQAGSVEVKNAGSDAVDIEWFYANGHPGNGPARLMTEDAKERQERDIIKVFTKWVEIREEPKRLGEIVTVFPRADLKALAKYDEGVNSREIAARWDLAVYKPNGSAQLLCSWTETTHRRRPFFSTSPGGSVNVGAPPTTQKTAESFIVFLTRGVEGYVIDHLQSVTPIHIVR